VARDLTPVDGNEVSGLHRPPPRLRCPPYAPIALHAVEEIP